MKENFGNKTFSFETIYKKDVLDLINQLPGNKATVSNDIPVSVLKESVSAYYEKLTDIFNNCIRSGTFPEILKKSELIPVFKKDWRLEKNYSHCTTGICTGSFISQHIVKRSIFLSMLKIKI